MTPILLSLIWRINSRSCLSVDSSMTLAVPSGRTTRLGLEARSKAPHLKSGPGSAAIGQSPSSPCERLFEPDGSVALLHARLHPSPWEVSAGQAACPKLADTVAVV